MKLAFIIPAVLSFITLPFLPKQSPLSNEAWVEKDLDISKWEVINDNKNSTVDYSFTSEFEGSYLIEINKQQDCYSGVSIDISSQMEAFASQVDIGEAVGLNFKLVNTISLESTNTLDIMLSFSDGSGWKILPTQSFTGIPSLYDINIINEVQIDFSSIPGDKTYASITSLQLGVNGSDSSKFYVYDFTMSFSPEAGEEEVEVNTAGSIGIYGSTFGKYQYGGSYGTSTNLTIVTDESKSKEDDGSSLELSITGTTSTASRNYSCYLQLADQVNAASLTNPQTISFWIYNPSSFGGGLYFKVGSTELFDGVVVDEALNLLPYSRNLDYIGFRRYTLDLTDEQFQAKELEIGIWGANNDSCIYLSKFTFTDLAKPKIGYIYVGAMNSFSYSSFTDGPSFAYDSLTNSSYSHSEDLTAVRMNRSGHSSKYFSCVYIQKFGQRAEELKIKKPTLLSLWVNSQLATTDQTGLAFKLKFSDSSLKEIFPTNTDRTLEYTGFNNYIFNISSYNIFDVVEFECSVWGADAADVYFSDIHIFDGATKTLPVANYEDINIAIDDFIPLTSSIDTEMTYEDGNINYVTRRNALKGTTSIARSIDDISNENLVGIQLVVTATVPFDHNVINFELVYKDDSGVEASYIVSSTSFSEEHGGLFEANLTTLPYFINNLNITKIRLSCIGDDSVVNVSVHSLKAQYDEAYNASPIHSKTICDFEDESSVLDWGISGEASSIYYKEYDTDAKVGDGCLKYSFSSMTDSSFSWSEIYYDLNDLIVKNADKNIYGLSFWLYNAHYVTAGNFGYWIKVSQTDGMEFEVKYNHIITELDTNNNLAFTGWQKIQIPLDGAFYSEASYNDGYSKDNERVFDWKKLQFIKFGFWGTYYNSEDGYSAIAKVDEFSFISGEQIIDESETYNITYVLNGGTLPSGAKKKYIEGESFVLPIPKRNGFAFEGWFKNQTMTGNPIEEITSEMKGDIVLYAAWSKIEGYQKRMTAVIVSASAGSALVIGGAVLAVILIKKKKKKV